MTIQEQKIFFGRRKGKPLREYHADLMLNFLPYISVDLMLPAPPIDILEIGFGGGEHLIHAALNAPDKNFLGVEAFENGVAKAVAAVEKHNLTNVKIHFGTAEEVLAWLPAQSLERIDLFYPDPWPKKRHFKRRFLNDEKLPLLAHVLKPKGYFRFATDIESYKEWGLERIARSENFSFFNDTPYEVWVPTRYEQKALREGRTPSYYTFIKG